MDPNQGLGVVPNAFYRCFEDQPNFCALLGCFLPRQNALNFCCVGHETLAGVLSQSQNPYHVYGGFQTNAERDKCLLSLLISKVEQVERGIPTLDGIDDDLFSSMPWLNPRLVLPNPHPESCCFIFFKPRASGYPWIENVVQWRTNAVVPVDYDGRTVTRQIVSFRWICDQKGGAGNIEAVAMKNTMVGTWLCVNFMYNQQTIFCITYKRGENEPLFLNKDVNGDKKNGKDKEDDGKKDRKDDGNEDGKQLPRRRPRKAQPQPKEVPYYGVVTTGVIAMGWCPSDSSYPLTCAKDNRTICWDTNTVEILAELPDARLYPVIPASSFEVVDSAMVNNDLTSLISTRSHKFWKETLAYLCAFAQREERTILCNALASKLMAAGNPLAAVLCYVCAGNVDRALEVWSRSLANERNIVFKSAEQQLKDLMEKTLVLALATGNKRFSTSLCQLLKSYAEILACQGLPTLAMIYFEVLDAGGLSPEVSILRDQIALSETETAASVVNTQPQSTLAYNQESTQVLANVVGNSYDNQYQQQQYTDSHVPPTSHPAKQQPAPQVVVSAMVNNDLTSLSHKFWKEKLAYLCTFAQREERTILCNALASKLMAAGNPLAAALCYVCAGNVDRTLEVWSRSLANGRNIVFKSAEQLKDLMEKTLVLALATGNKRFSTSLCQLLEIYAEILASQGLPTLAMTYFEVLDAGGLSPEVSIFFRDQIALSETETAASVVNTQPQSTLAYNQESTQVLANVVGNSYDNHTDSYVPPTSHPAKKQPAPQ